MVIYQGILGNQPMLGNEKDSGKMAKKTCIS